MFGWITKLFRPKKKGGAPDPVVPGQYDSDQRTPGQSPDPDYPDTPGNPTTPGEVLVDHP